MLIGKTLEIKGKRVVAVHTKGGNTKFIHDVFYVPNNTFNLLSVGQLLKKGYKLIFYNDKCEIIEKNTNQLITRAKTSATKVFALNMPSDEKLAF